MKAKGVIRKQVQWSESRTFFYWRLKRRLKEFEIVNMIYGNKPVIGQRKQAIAQLKHWYCSQGNDIKNWEDDRMIVTWFEDHIKDLNIYVTKVKVDSYITDISMKLSNIVQSASNVNGANTTDILKEAFIHLSESERKQLLDALK